MLSRTLTQDDTASFKTRHFHHYQIEGVDFDVMAGFVIVSKGIAYECPLHKEDITLYHYDNIYYHFIQSVSGEDIMHS